MDTKKMTYGAALRMALREEMEKNENVFLMGEDIGVYGGNFGVTEGLLEEFGEGRVMDTPITESVMVGTATGAAITGLRPVAEMIFSDFIAFGMDSLVNQAAKTHYMYGGQEKVPLVVRLPSGHGTGAAAQHSQNLEAWFCHVPGLKVVTPTTPAQAKGLLKAAIRDDNPVVFVEHKYLYKIAGEVPLNPEYTINIGESIVEKEGSDVTIVAWGKLLIRAMAAVQPLEDMGISIEIINPTTLYPMDMRPIESSVKKTGRLMIAHEAAKTGGVGAEIAAKITESDCFDYLKGPIRRLCSLDVPIPFNKKLEDAVAPKTEDIVAAVIGMMERPERKNGGVTLDELEAYDFESDEYWQDISDD